VPSDTIDLHGQYVEEAEKILKKRIEEARRQNQNHLHVIVGKGNHSTDHIQKIKPAVERLCDEMGIAHRVEHNEGRLYLDLTGQGDIPDQLPPPGQSHWGPGGYQGSQQGYQGHQQPAYQQPHGHQQQQHHQQQQQQDQGQEGLLGLFIKIIRAICK